MTTYDVGNLDKWAGKVKGNMDTVVKVATYDLMQSMPIKFGIMKSGARVPGSIPWDTGALAKSLNSQLNRGGTSLAGPDSYAAISKLMKAGDTALFWWDVPYALAAHDGTDKVVGTFWVSKATARWQSIVKEAVATAERSA